MRVIVAARLSQLADGQTGLDTQDVESTKWAVANGHEIVHVAADIKTGMSHPWDRKNLRPWVTEGDKLALYDAVVAYKLDRLSRGDNASTNAIEDWAREHGKKLLTVDGLVFPCEGTDGIRWDVTKRIAHQEWLGYSEKYRRMQGYLRGEGKLVGRPPFGYTTADAEGGHKMLVPTDTGRIIVPAIFAWCINGDSLTTIAERLTALEVPPVSGKSWWAKSVGQIIRNTTYRGERQDARGKTIHRCEPLVDPATFRRAGQVLDSGPKRGPVLTGNRAMLAGVLTCPACDGNSPMYRLKCGSTLYYRCTGRGAQRHGCGNMVQLDKTDAAVSRIIDEMFGTPVMVKRLIPGHNFDAELAQVACDVAQLAHRDLSRAEYRAELDRLWALEDELKARKSVPDQVIEEPLGQSYAELWHGLGNADRAEFLKKHGFTVYADKRQAGLERGEGVTWHGGVFVFELGVVLHNASIMARKVA